MRDRSRTCRLPNFPSRFRPKMPRIRQWPRTQPRYDSFGQEFTLEPSSEPDFGSTTTVMRLRFFRFATLILAALGLSLGVSHTLELPAKMNYGGDLYMAVTSTL